MRKAIIYASVHHGNTEKLVKSIAEECQVDLIDAVKQSDADLSSYDMIGFASGIYFSKFHQSMLKFAEKNLPDDKKVLDKLGLDADEIVNMKMDQNEAKYPVEKAKGSAAKYTEL